MPKKTVQAKQIKLNEPPPPLPWRPQPKTDLEESREKRARMQQDLIEARRKGKSADQAIKEAQEKQNQRYGRRY